MRSPVLVLPLLVAAALSARGAEPVVLSDFEDGTVKPFQKDDKVSIVAEHATSGGHAAMVQPGGFLNADSYSGLTADWSKRDLVKFDVFVPGDKNVKLAIQVRDTMNEPGYWAWHNRYTALAPGQNTVQFAVADIWRGEVLRRDVPGMLDPKQIKRFVITLQDSPVPLYIDNIRLESYPAAKVDVPGLKAFDVEPVGAPGFVGFASLTDKDAYAKDKGYGWKAGSSFMNTNANVCIRLHPDNLFRDWISLRDAELQVDVPNGKYHVFLQLEDPSAWELMQNYRHRTVSAEGATVVDQSMSCEDFLKKYFRNQDAEDLPGQDPFDKYVETRHPWTEFDVTVADGQLDLGFRSEDAYGATLSAVVIAPAAEADKTKQFMTFVKEMRRFDWAQSWKPVSKPPTAPAFTGAAATDAKRDGYALYAVSPYAKGDYNGDVSGDPLPAKDPAIKDFHLAAALGETEPATFGLRPARGLGKVEVTVSALKGPGGAELPAANVAVRVGRYRVSRQGEQSGLYEIRERELRLFNRTEADVLRCDDGMARRFWIIIDMPEDAKPGSYAGTVTVKAEKGGTRAIPIVIDALPFKLPAPDHTFAMYGTDLLPSVYYPEQAAHVMRDRERMLKDLASHGINSLIGTLVAPTCAWKGDRVEITNLKEVDAAFALCRKYGFIDTPVAFPNGGTPEALATNQAIQGKPCKEFIEGWYKSLTDIAKANGWPHPYFCYGDEPNIPTTLNQLSAIHNALHAVSPEIWTAIAYHVQSPESEAMMKTVDVHHFKAFCTVEQFKQAKAYAKYMLNCNVGFGRASFGLREWRAANERGTDGCITYSYTGSHIDLFYDLDGRESDYSCAAPRLDGTRDTVANWECTREGVDDYRYARALLALAKDAKAPKATAAAAEALLKDAFDIGGEGKAAGIPAASAWRTGAQKVLTDAATK
jgi:hypothetical protein